MNAARKSLTVVVRAYGNMCMLSFHDFLSLMKNVD